MFRSVIELLLIAWCVWLVIAYAPGTTHAQEGPLKPNESLMDVQSPFDLITLTAEAGGESVRVYPIEFPNRVVPTSEPGDKELEVTLLIYPDRKYRVFWKDIAEIKLYEQMIVERAKQYMADNDYANAFEHLNFLIQNYPKTPMLGQLRQDFLMESAKGLYRLKKLPQALAVLEEIRRSEPNLKPQDVGSAISRISTELIQEYFDQGKLQVAQQIVARLKNEYGSQIPAVTQWETKFRTLAEEYRSQAVQLLSDKQYNEAREAALKMIEVDPTTPNGNELVAEIEAAHPTLRVAVFETTKTPNPTSLSDWPSRRVGALVTRSLFEFQNTGPEGGKYEFALGSVEISDSQTEVMFQFDKKVLESTELPDAFEVAQWMLRKAQPANPSYDAAWSAIFSKVEVDGRDFLKAYLRQSHVLPVAFLQWPLAEAKQGLEVKPLGNYRLGVESNPENGMTQKVFVWNQETQPAAGQAIDVIEQRFNKPIDAIASLLNRRIDVIDRVFPADAKQLANDKRIRVEPYALPIVHMLVPRGDNKYVNSLSFRRGLMYAIDREGLLRGALLGGPLTPESRPISGPFPVGADINDPLSYAYNDKVTVLPYDINLAKLLIESTKSAFKTAAEKSKEPVPELTELVLGVPDFEAARVAGEECVQQWARIGVPAKVVVLNEDNKDVKVDILYVSAAMWEPALDAVRLMGEGGIAETDNPFIVQALTSLRLARNWRQVRAACQDIHALVDAHLPIMPLYQIGEAFAYRASITGVPRKPVTLYQNINRWRITTNAANP